MEVRNDHYGRPQEPQRPEPNRSGLTYMHEPQIHPRIRRVVVDEHGHYRDIVDDVRHLPEAYYRRSVHADDATGPPLREVARNSQARNRHPLFTGEAGSMPARPVRRVVVVRRTANQDHPPLGDLSLRDGRPEPETIGQRIWEPPYHERPASPEQSYRESDRLPPSLRRLRDENRRAYGMNLDGSHVVQHQTPLGYQERVVPEYFPSTPSSSSYALPQPEREHSSFQPPLQSVPVSYPSLPESHTHDQRDVYGGQGHRPGPPQPYGVTNNANDVDE